MTTPTLTEGIKKLIKAENLDTHTALVAKVQNFNPQNSRADVIPVNEFISSVNEGQGYEDPPVLKDVPVVHSEYGEFRVVSQLQRGQDVLVICSESSLDEWRGAGRTGNQPQDERRFDLSDALIIPGVNPDSGGQSISPTTAAKLEHDGGMTIEFTSQGKIAIKGPAGQSVFGLLLKAIEQIVQSTVATNSGPKPLLPASTSVPNLIAQLRQLVE